MPIHDIKFENFPGRRPTSLPGVASIDAITKLLADVNNTTNE